MKRLTMLAAALVLVLGMAVSASAAPEVAISGNLLVNAVWQGNWNFDKKSTPQGNNEAMTIYERADLYFTVTANENLKGVLGLRSQRGEWGKANFAVDAAGGAAAAGAQLNIRDAYIDFNWPGTDVNVKAGLQPVGLPAAVGGGSMIQNARTSAVMLSTAFTDNVSLLAGYARLLDLNTANGQTNLTDVDAWILALPLTFEGFNMSPYFAYSNPGKNVTSQSSADVMGMVSNLNATAAAAYQLNDLWWLGTDFTMNLFDPFILKADLAYGQANGKGSGNERAGWLFDMALEYTGLDFMTPEAFFVYTSGEDGNSSKGNGKSERMPILAGDWAVGSFFFGGDSITGGSLDSRYDQMGFWALGLSLKDIQSFAEGLTHTAHIMYVAGTNNKDSINDAYATNNLDYGRSLTTKENLVEIDFNTAYQIYDELTFYNDIGYINLNADDRAGYRGVNNKGGDAWKFSTGVVYQF